MPHLPSPFLAVLCAALVAFAAPPAHARQAGDLGEVVFENTGAPAAQGAFMRGLLFLHSFEYEDARTAFREARAADPDFAMAYWGEAMTHNHPLWYRQDREAAREVLAAYAPTPEARAARTADARERAWLGALDVLFDDGDKTARDDAYRDAMRDLHEAYPDDLEAAAFYALSILGSVPARDFRTYMRAAAVAEEVFARNPQHPGAAHYLIHSYDDPVHAPLGLRAARRYADIAPAASHAQHMISHIYTALGEWDEVVAANEKSVAVSEDRLRGLGRPVEFRNKHALLWLMYGLLQQGRVDEAREALAVMDADARAHPTSGHDWHHAAMRAAYAVEDPLGDALPAPLGRAEALSAVALDAFAGGFAAAARGDAAGLRRAAEDLRTAVDAAETTAAEEGRSAYDGATSADDRLVAGLMARQLAALAAFHAGDADAAVEMLRRAAEDEVARPLEYGPPSVPKPGDELLGEMLLVLGRADEAVAHFERTLERNPRRARALAGLARAADASGDAGTAAEARATLAEMTHAATARDGYPWLGTR